MMMAQRHIRTFAAALVVIITTAAPVFASQDTVSHEAAAGRSSREEPHRPPAALIFQWAGLLIILGVGGHYVFERCREKAARRESRWRAYVLTAAALAVLSLNYHPAVGGFDEPPVLGFIKFLLALVCAGLLTFYGVLGRHDKHHGEASTHGGAE